MFFPEKPIEHYAQQAPFCDEFGWHSTYAALLWKLRHHMPFSLARYTDGEWSAIWRRAGCNIDGHQYYADMADALAASLRDPSPHTVFGTQHLIMKQSGKKVAEWLRLHGCNQRWVPGEALHEASKAMLLYMFVNALRDRVIIYVGPKYLEELPFRFHRIDVPERSVWKSSDRILDSLTEAVAGSRGIVVLYSCSMPAEYYIYRVNQICADITQIDVGSIWDPYLGIRSRTYHRKMEVTVEDLIGADS